MVAGTRYQKMGALETFPPQIQDREPRGTQTARVGFQNEKREN